MQFFEQDPESFIQLKTRMPNYSSEDYAYALRNAWNGSTRMDLAVRVLQTRASKRERILYLAIQHGTSVATAHELYQIRCDFNRIIHYVLPYTVLKSETMQPLIDGTWQQDEAFQEFIMNGRYISPISVIHGQRYAAVPPLLFYIQKSDLENDFYRATMGVWRIVIQNYSIRAVENVVDIDEWYHLLGTQVTQPTLFELIASVVKRRDVVSEVDVGIGSCHNQTATDLEHHISYTSAKVRPPSVQKDLFLKVLTKGDYSLATLPGIPVEHLANHYTVGCGMNVLIYYGIIAEDEAMPRRCALPQRQSIFSIYTILQESNPDRKFLVRRYRLNLGIQSLLNAMPMLAENKATVVKLYSEDKDDTGDHHHGHILAIERTGSLFVVDPQYNRRSEFTTGDQLYDILTRDYPDKQFIDMVMQTPGELGAVSAIELVAKFPKGRIITPVDFGGRTRRKVRKARSYRRKRD